MKQIKNFAKYYVALLARPGLKRFSALIATLFVVFAIIVQMIIVLLLEGKFDVSDFVRSALSGLLISPLVVYFLSVVIEELDESRQDLANLVSKLELMRKRDMVLNTQLTDNITQLNLEIEERKRAEEGREEAMNDLENEVYHREKAQLELAERTALLRSFIDTSPDLIFYRNEKGLFLGCNKALETLVGKKEKELVGLTPWQVYKTEIATKVVETDKQLFATNLPVTYEQCLECSDGRMAYFELSKVPLYARDGRRLGLVGFGREITERKEYQDALEKASRDKTAFISTISHELRTPLNGIVGLSRILLDTQLNQEQLAYLRTIHVSAITLGNIFNDIIDIDKSDREQLALLVESINFVDFLSDIENISALMAKQKGLRFSFDKFTPLPNFVDLDPTRLRQILWNLVGNAVKFTQQGGAINISVSCEFLQDKVAVQFDIEDTGIGIPASELNNIFSMYYQVKEGSGNLHAVGTGIGLSVSRQLAKLMGGDIYVDSELGEGSVFSLSIHLPLSQAKPELIGLNAPFSPLRILLIEDIELNITVATNLLESLGHKVEIARNGQEALSLCKMAFSCLENEPCPSGQKGFDLVLLDIQLPDMTGFDVALTLRKTYVNLPPLVALTANLIKDKTEYLQKGMDDAISKPIDVSALNRVLAFISNRPKSVKKLRRKKTKRLKKQINLVQDNPLFFDENVPQTYQEVDTKGLNEQRLDLEMLDSYLSLVGFELVMKNVQLFDELLPDYLALLEQAFIDDNNKAIIEQAHKIKGAAGSVGLKAMQILADKLQSAELSLWENEKEKWFDLIKKSYQADLALLRRWLLTKKGN